MKMLKTAFEFCKKNPVEVTLGILSVVSTALSVVVSKAGTLRDREGARAIPYGRTRNTGGHDHRTNTGLDRTVAQRIADQARRKS